MEEFGAATLFHAKDAVGMGCLYYAARYGNEQIVSLLIAHGIDVNQRFSSNQTAIFRAKANIIGLLVDAKADINARSTTGWTPLHAAAHWGPWTVIKILLSHGAELEAVVVVVVCCPLLIVGGMRGERVKKIGERLV